MTGSSFGDNIFAPVEGTPLPPGAVPAGTPPGAPPPPGSPAIPQSAPPPPAPAEVVPPAPVVTPPSPAEVPPPPAGADGVGPSATPSSFGTVGSVPGPSVAVAQYNPLTGQYVAPDGQVFRQSDLVTPAAVRTWKDLLPT